MRSSLSVAVAVICFALFAVPSANAKGGGGGGVHNGANNSSKMAVLRARQDKAKILHLADR
jgi:hypothetical protein